jgi:hypothetical protein
MMFAVSYLSKLFKSHFEVLTTASYVVWPWWLLEVVDAIGGLFQVGAVI